jgi:SET domain-containing protein
MSLKPLNFLKDGIYVTGTSKRGKGVFTTEYIPKGILIEVAPVIVMSNEQRMLLDQTLLHDYIFEWGRNKKQCCLALGYISIYNHSYHSNCEYEMNFAKEIISVKSVQDIHAGDELLINYNGTYNNSKPVWFDVR